MVALYALSNANMIIQWRFSSSAVFTDIVVPAVRCVDIIAPANGSTRKFESGGLQHQSFDCNTGFVLNGSRLSTCNNVRWDPAKPPTCVGK